MINILIENIIITSKILDIEEMFKCINDKSLILSSKEEVNKWSIQRAKRLRRNWWKNTNHFRKNDRLYRYAVYSDVLTVVPILRYLTEIKHYKFLFESNKVIEDVLTEQSNLSKINFAKVQSPNLNKPSVIAFEDKNDFKIKINQLLDSNLTEPKHLHRHHYDTINNEFKEKYKGEIEYAIMNIK